MNIFARKRTVTQKEIVLSFLELLKQLMMIPQRTRNKSMLIDNVNH